MAISKHKAIDLLKRQQSLIGEFPWSSLPELAKFLHSRKHSAEFEKWRMDTKDLIAEIASTFPCESIKYFPRRFQKITYGDLDNSTGVAKSPVYIEDVGSDMERASHLLQSLIENLRNYASDELTTRAQPESNVGPSGSDVFIAYGHDALARHEVADLVRSLGLNPIIYEDELGRGRTTIEKIEDLASNVGFAVVLMTPDDLGAAASDIKNPNPRARQNVIFELGYFAKALGRGCVAALRKGDVEVPSNYDGVEYIKFEGNWKLKLAKEIKAAGLPVDTDKMI